MDAIQFSFRLALAILVVGVLVCVWLYFKKKTGWQAVGWAFAGTVWLALMALRMPANVDTEDVLSRHFLAALEALRYFSLDMPFKELDNSLTALATWDYYAFEIVLSVAAPLCTAAAVFSLLHRAGRLRLYVMYWRPVYYFSELNEKSFTLASNLIAAWRKSEKWLHKPVLVFCKVAAHDDGEELGYRNEARKLGAVFYADPITSIHKSSPWLREVKVFLIGTDESENMSAALNMKKWISAPEKLYKLPLYRDSDLLVFSTEESAELLFEKLLEDVKKTRTEAQRAELRKKDIKDLQKETETWEKLRQKAEKKSKDPGAVEEKLQELAKDHLAKERFGNEDSRVDLHLVNETKLMAQKLLWEHPLFDASVVNEQGERQVSLLIVGGGRLGMEVLRTALVSGVMDQCSFKATVIDSAGHIIRQQFLHDYPYLPDCVKNTVTFRRADVTTVSFDRVLEQDCRDCTYIVVSTGDDERSMATAQFLRRWYARQSIREGNVPDYAQKIYVAVRSSDHYETLKNLSSGNLTLFGCNTHVFCPEELLNRKLDRAAAMFNRCYKFTNDTMLLDKLCPKEEEQQTQTIKEAKRDYFRLKTVNQLSNQLAALHSLYKLQDLLYREGTGENVRVFTKEDTEKMFRRLVSATYTHRNALYKLEHRRWEVFQAMDGWSPFPKNMIEACAGKDEGQQEHKHLTAKLHGCLMPYDDLIGLAETVKDKFPEANPKLDFQAFDKAMCVASLLAWLELVADQKQGKCIRNQIMENAKKEASAEDVLKYLYTLYPATEAVSQ